MKGNLVNSLALFLIVLGQGAIVYKIYVPSVTPPAARQQRPPIQDAPADAAIELAGFPIQGVPRAKVVLIEFSDYECPFCARHATDVFPELHKRFVATGKMQYAYANNPLPFHRNAMMLAKAAGCAGKQQKYWEMHELLFARKPGSLEHIEELIQSLNLDVPRFRECMNDDKQFQQQLSRDQQRAREFGMSGTPGFLLGRLDEMGMVKVDKFIYGAQPLSVFETAIEDILEKVRGLAAQK